MISYQELIKNGLSDELALVTDDASISYAQMFNQVDTLMRWLKSYDPRSIAMHCNNSTEWVLVDLACQSMNIILTPIPLFFSDQQINEVLNKIKPDLLLSDAQSTSIYSLKSDMINSDVENRPLEMIEGCPLLDMRAFKVQQNERINAPQGTRKITFTSGSTGSPKGVCLSNDNQWQVAQSLVEVIGIEKPKHLCLLPLPTLLENIAGVYAPLLAGGTVVIPSDEARGFRGSRLVAPNSLLECISSQQPNTLILVPELLQVLVHACLNGWLKPDSLQFIAVGGSKVSPKLIDAARSCGLPVCQGYGLSECASVVSLCAAGDDANTCGRALPHLSVEIIENEIVVKGNAFLGYLNEPSSWGISEVYTGDIGSIEQGVLTIEGRKKNTLINSFGRNISPEWIESELLATGAFYQAIVIGDAKPFCSALLVPLNGNDSGQKLKKIVERLNQNLPDYAQVKNPIILSAPMTSEQGLYTDNMRPKRREIIEYFESKITRVYTSACA